MIEKRVDNTIPYIVGHNLRYRTIVNSTVMIEEFNKLLIKTIIIKGKGVAHGMNRSGMLTPEKQATPIVHWKSIYTLEQNQQIHL